jgi:hypothetical protein
MGKSTASPKGDKPHYPPVDPPVSVLSFARGCSLIPGARAEPRAALRATAG